VYKKANTMTKSRTAMKSVSPSVPLSQKEEGPLELHFKPKLQKDGNPLPTREGDLIGSSDKNAARKYKWSDVDIPEYMTAPKVKGKWETCEMVKHSKGLLLQTGNSKFTDLENRLFRTYGMDHKAKSVRTAGKPEFVSDSTLREILRLLKGDCEANFNGTKGCTLNGMLAVLSMRVFV
jgi:hypothetical protein